MEFEGHNMTFEALDRRANQLAHFLQKLGVGPGSLVGVSIKRSLEMVISLLGILKAGGAYVPMDPTYPSERLQFILADTRAQVVITQEATAEFFGSTSAQAICLDSDWQNIAQESEDCPAVVVTSTHPAYVIHTSGSTGTPKGVQVPHRAVVNFLYTMAREPGLTAEDILLAVTTLSFDIAGLELFLPLTQGARVVIASRATAGNGEQLSQALQSSRATIMQATPTTWQTLLNVGWQGSPDLKILCGGEALSRELADQLLPRCASLWNLYGPTETTIWSSLYRVQADSRPVPIGRPIGNTQCYVLDEQMHIVPVGVVGELYISGDGLADGYLNQPQLTAEKFLPNPLAKKHGSRLYRTGDLVRNWPDGNLEYIGRNDHQVKVRGHRIELGEIECLLNQHPAIHQCVVIVREDIPGDQRITAYYIPSEGSAPTTSELYQFLHAHLPEYMLPSSFMLLEEFPLTPNGKINRKALLAPNQTRPDIEKAFVPPHDAVEEVIAGIMASVLNLEQVGIHDNFFDLGGHSLLATQLVSRIREIFGIVTLRTFFQTPTVAGVAETLLKDPSQKPRVERSAEILLQLAELSDEQVEKILKAKKHVLGDAGEL